MAEQVTMLEDRQLHQQRKRAQRGRPSTKRPQMPGVPKQWPCDWPSCSKSFGRKSDLIRHHHTHTGTRNHKCPYASCAKTFIQTSALTVHIRTHTGEKPHECQVCGKRFSDSSSLARHRKIHSNERPYPCEVEVCDKSFCRKSTLNKHMDREHPGVAHSPLTESEDETSEHSRNYTSASFTSEEDMASPVSKAHAHTGMNATLIENELDAYAGANVSHFRRIAQQNPQPSANDYYSHTQPSTPLVSGWPQHDHAARSSSMHGRLNTIPVPLKPFDGSGIREMDPMTAPIVYSDQQYRNLPVMPHTASFMPQDFAQHYYSDVSGAPSPMYPPQDFRTASMDHHQNVSSVSPTMVPSCSEPGGDAQRVLEARIKAEQLVSAHQAQQPMVHPETEFYAYASQEYHEPMHLGVTTDLSAHYTLPGSNIGVWPVDEEKYPDSFGEPMPAQAINHWAC